MQQRENSTSGFHLVDYFYGAYEHLAAQWSGHSRATVHDEPYWIPAREAGLAAAGNRRRAPDDCSQRWEQNKQLRERWVGWPRL